MKRLLQISLLLNVALLAIAGWRNRPQAPARIAAALPGIREAGTGAPSVKHVISDAPDNTSPWSQVESADPAQFIANLRASGCPEATCRDIVTLRVCRQFRQRLIEMEVEALRSPTNTHTAGSDPRWERSQKVRNEMIFTIESLTGETSTALAFGSGSVPDWTDTLSIDKRRQLRELESRDALTVARLQDHGHRRPEILAEIQEFDRQKQADLAGILSPQEFEEYLYHESSAATYVRGKCPEARSEAEYRAMVKLALELGMTSVSLALHGGPAETGVQVTPAFITFRHPGVGGGGNRGTDVPVAPAYLEQKAAFQERLKEVLGAERMAELAELQAAEKARAELDQWWQVSSVAEGMGIPSESARQYFDRVHEMRPALSAQLAEMEKNLTGTPEEKRKQMESVVRAEYEKVALETMGERGRHVNQIVLGLLTNLPR